MARLTNLDALKSDLNALVVKILTLGKAEENAGKYEYYKEKLNIASALEDIIKKHFNNTVFGEMTNEEARDIAVNGYKHKKC
tara:strand:- start:2012 stop:2257 length:246 start_codon:yes stop_codon:yes gene_type:complete